MPNISAQAEELELFHYGVKGMTWGVTRRSGGVKSRFKEGKVADNDRMIKTHTAIRDRKAGKLGNALSAPDKLLMGEKRFKKYHNSHINALTAQNDRIKSGKTTVLDKIDIVGNTPVMDLVLKQK